MIHNTVNNKSVIIVVSYVTNKKLRLDPTITSEI